MDGGGVATVAAGSMAARTEVGTGSAKTMAGVEMKVALRGRRRGKRARRRECRRDSGLGVGEDGSGYGLG